MSHLIHVVNFKEQLSANGITCPLKQSELLKEPFTRAITRFFYKNNILKSEDFEKTVWRQLEKWNNISPIPAQQIMAMFNLRYNLVRNTLMKTGGLPNANEFTTWVTANNAVEVDVTKVEGFSELVDYLVKELENYNE